MSTGDGFAVRSLACTYFDGTRLHRHDHPWGQLAFCTSGLMRILTDEVAWLSPPTRAIWLPAGLVHEIVMKGEVTARFLYISPGYGARLGGRPQVLEVLPLLRELILHVLAVGMLHPDKPEHARLAGLLIDLLIEARPVDMALPLPRDRRALALATRIQSALGDTATLTELARGVGASLRTLQRLFPEETGLTLEAWRQKARLIASAVALSSGAAVNLTAANCGYESPSAFITAFKRQFGVTPGRYRAEL